MSFRQVPSQRQRGFKLRQRSDRTFSEAMEGCAEHERLTVRPVFTYRPLVVAVRYGLIPLASRHADGPRR